jgi:hypothetical protein
MGDFRLSMKEPIVQTGDGTVRIQIRIWAWFCTPALSKMIFLFKKNNFFFFKVKPLKINPACHPGRV